MDKLEKFKHARIRPRGAELRVRTVRRLVWFPPSLAMACMPLAVRPGIQHARTYVQGARRSPAGPPGIIGCHSRLHVFIQIRSSVRCMIEIDDLHPHGPIEMRSIVCPQPRQEAKQRPKRPLASRKGRFLACGAARARGWIYHHRLKRSRADPAIRISTPTNRILWEMGAGQLNGTTSERGSPLLVCCCSHLFLATNHRFRFAAGPIDRDASLTLCDCWRHHRPSISFTVASEASLLVLAPSL